MDLFYDPKKIKFWIYDYIEIINKKGILEHKNTINRFTEEIRKIYFV